MKTKGFGAYLREWRMSAGMNQTELAEAAGKVCTPQYISLLEKEAERGDYITRPSAEIVTALADALSIPVDVMLRLAGHAPRNAPPSEEDEMLHALITELDPATRGDVLAIVQALLRRRKTLSSELPLKQQPQTKLQTKLQTQALPLIIDGIEVVDTSAMDEATLEREMSAEFETGMVSPIPGGELSAILFPNHQTKAQQGDTGNAVRNSHTQQTGEVTAKHRRGGGST